MTDETREKNEIIAEFHGWTQCGQTSNGIPLYHFPEWGRFPCSRKGFLYQVSWEWLMPVIKKCHSIRNKDEDTFNLYSGFLLDETPIWASIEVAYDRVLAFIIDLQKYRVGEESQQPVKPPPSEQSIE